MNTIRLLLVDDHAIVRAGLRALLDSAGDIQIVGEAENGQQAVEAAERLRPDVVLLDLGMPLLNGVEATRQIAREVPRARVLILSSYSDEQHVRQAVAAGVAGYVIKESAGEQLLEAIRETANGGAFFSPALHSHLVKRWLERSACGLEAQPSAPALSARHAEVLQLIAEGYCNKQIAALLFISQKTTERHRYHLMRKLNLHKISTLTRYAVSSGVVESNRVPNWPATPVGVHAHKSGKHALMM